MSSADYRCRQARGGPRMEAGPRLDGGEIPNERPSLAQLDPAKLLDGDDWVVIARLFQQASLGRACSAIAHQMRNPLCSASGNVQALARDFSKLERYWTAVSSLKEAARVDKGIESALRGLELAEAEADIDYIRGDFPCALVETLESIQALDNYCEQIAAFARAREGESVVDANAIPATVVAADPIASDHSIEFDVTARAPGWLKDDLGIATCLARMCIDSAKNYIGKSGTVHFDSDTRDGYIVWSIAAQPSENASGRSSCSKPSCQELLQRAIMESAAMLGGTCAVSPDRHYMQEISFPAFDLDETN